MTFREAVTARLADELGDSSLAEQLVARLGDDALNTIEELVGSADVGTSLAFAIEPPTVDASGVGSLVAFAFGNRFADDGSLRPGPVNEALARVTAAFVVEHPIPVYAQWEVAELLIAEGVPGVVSIDPDTDAAGVVTYLSTAGVAAKAVALAAARGTQLGHVGVIGFADHAVRCVLTARAAGMTADVPDGVDLPAEYDPLSGQEWTRDRLGYLAVDLIGRVPLLAG